MIDPVVVEDVTVIANIALALSLVAAVVFGIAQVNAASRDRRERLTLETLRNFQTREFAELMYHVQRRTLPKTEAELLALPRDEQVLFIQMAQQMEYLGLQVAEKLINLDLVDETLGSFVTDSWKKYKPVFQDMRGTMSDPYLGEYFQWLAEVIDRRMREAPRQPYYTTRIA